MRFKLFILLMSISAISQSQQTKTALKWQVGYADQLNEEPNKWVSAKVPGAVQLDIAKVENYGPYYYAENWKDYLWMEDKFFTYKTSFERQKLKDGERLFFFSGGIDYEFEIYLNGEKLLYQEGMFTPVELDITDKVDDNNELLIKIYPIPKLHTKSANRTQAAQSVKPAVSYSWDWHPRLVPSGIWKETYLEVKNASCLTDVWVDYELDDELDHADIELKLEGFNLKNCEVDWQLQDRDGKVVAQSKTDGLQTDVAAIKGSLDNPNLWWPHDHGDAYLYTSITKLYDASGKLLETQESKIGFRSIRLVMSEGAWDRPQDFPKGRSVAPIQVQINHRNIFAKGTNWVAPEIFPSEITLDRYREMIERGVEANFNMFRIWGGCIVNTKSFYDLCDELGVLVWTEFPLSCNNYVGTPEYLKVLKQESESIIKAVRKHASNAMWCGGNELYNSWGGMTEQSLALRLLNSQCLLMDPNTPYINTSPIIGMAHGHYVFKDWENGEEVYARMQRANNTAYTEFGMPAPSSVEVLKTIIPEDELWPPKPGTSWESHHAYKAWVGDTWLMQDMINDYFGKVKDLEELVANGQLVQCEGYKAIYEEARRQKPYCTMALNWCFNEPWPTAANNSLINWPNIPKPAFYAVRDACRPFLASAQIKKFKWTEGETFTADIWLLNDVPEKIAGGKVIAKLKAGDREVHLLDWEFDVLEANVNAEGPTVRVNLPRWETDRFELIVEVEGKPQYTSSYTMLYEKSKRQKKPFTPVLNQ
jgi:beta-mannosidase